MKKSTPLKYAIVLGAGTVLALSAPFAASAHVTIDPAAAQPGSYAIVTVKVPNESSTAKTNRVELTIPIETPFSSVRYVPVAGWEAELVSEELAEPVTVGDREITEAVTSVVWTALPGSEIGAGQLQQFALSLGPVPDTGSIVLAAEQTYTDGEVVSWSGVGEDAEHPAPVLYVNDAPVDSHGAAAAVAAVETKELASAGSDDVLARMLGIAGLVLGTVGVLIGVTAWRRKVA